MQRKIASFAVLIAILSACSAPTTDLTPPPSNVPQTATQAPSATPTENAATATFTPDLTLTAIATWTPAPTPTQEVAAFNIYRVKSTSNIRDGASLNAPVLGQLSAGVYIVAYPTGLNADGYSWLWLLNTCDETATTTGFVALTVNVVRVEVCP